MSATDGMTEVDILEAMLEKDQIEIDLLRVEVEYLRGRRDAALLALKPFANAACDIAENVPDRWTVWERPEAMEITVGDLRRAFALCSDQQTTVAVPRPDGGTLTEATHPPHDGGAP
jgi:hypothetical protein